MSHEPIQRAPQADRSFLEAIARLSGGRALVIGDVMLDECVRGAAERMSPDAPVPVMCVDLSDNGTERSAGGAGNVAVCLRGLDVAVDVVAIIGDDSAGEQLCDELAAVGVGIDALVHDHTRPTTVKRSLVGLAQHRHPQKMFRLDIESKAPVSSEIDLQLREAFDAKFAQADVVCIEDYNKGVCSDAFCQYIIARCNEASIPVLVDPASLDSFERYRGATAITPNRTEAERAMHATGSLGRDLEHASALAHAMFEAFGVGKIVLTLDRDGAIIVDEHTTTHLPTEAREVYDVTGAGDMVLAGLAAGIANGFDWLTSVRLANLAAGLVVEQLGAGPIELTRLRTETLRLCGGGKVRALEHLLLDLEIHRANGKRIVLTNGCFDVLHAGHVAYLKEARQRGDVLVVGVNADVQVKALKGDGRPIFSELERLEILEEFASVDYLVLFTEPTAHALIEAVLPDLYVKGGDYAPETIAEFDHLQTLGIEVDVLAERPGLGSSAIIDRIRAIDHR